MYMDYLNFAKTPQISLVASEERFMLTKATRLQAPEHVSSHSGTAMANVNIFTCVCIYIYRPKLQVAGP